MKLNTSLVEFNMIIYLSKVPTGAAALAENLLCLASLYWRLLTSRVDLSTHLNKCLKLVLDILISYLKVDQIKLK